MNEKMRLTCFAFLLLWIGTTGCKPSPQAVEEEGETPMALQITSSAFSEGETIPRKHTCDGENVSPPLSWSGAPEGTKSLVLIADDPDAPRGVFLHWLLYDIPAETASLAEGTQGVGVPGLSDARKAGYYGPCPPPGPAHRYFFRLYALDTALNLKAGANRSEVEQAMKGHVLAQGQLMGKYGR